MHRKSLFRSDLFPAVALISLGLAACKLGAPTAPSGVSDSGTIAATPVPTATPGTGTTTTPYMFVMNGLAKTIDQVDLSTDALTKSVLTTGLYPNQLASIGSYDWLVNSGDATIYKLDLAGHQNLGTINLPTGSNPMTLAPLSSAATEAIVTNNIAQYVDFVNLSTLALEATASLPAGHSAGGGLAIADGKAYVAAVTADYTNYPAVSYTFSGIDVIDLSTRSLLKTITMDATADPLPVQVDPNGKIDVGYSEGVYIIDPSTDQITQTIDFGTPINSLAFASASVGYGSADGDALVSFDPSTGAIIRDQAHELKVGDSSVGDIQVFDGKLYVPNFSTSTVTSVDLASEATASVCQLTSKSGPQELAFVTATP